MSEASFFGLSDTEADSVDPHYRLLMLKFVHSLDDAGYGVEKMNGTKTSVHIGQFSTDHAVATTRMRPEHRSRFHGPNSLLYNASARLSYYFNIHGPNVSLDVACSSSLDALHMAVQCPRRDEADMAVCSVDHLVLMLMVMLKVKSDDLGLLLLKQLSDAEREGDPIKANYLGRLSNQSNLDIPLLLDLIKSNLGHTEGAAGVASLIKVAMCMYRRGITANMQFTSLNPKIEAQKYNLHIVQNFVSFPIFLNNEKIAIGINSFGMGGTTTHAIIEEYQPNKKTSITNGHINGYHNKKQINAFLNEQPLPGLSIISRPTKPLAQKICFVFSGQGPPWWCMDRQSYESEPLFNK
ncbi:unnamed protein product [Adineta steineri]|uniref:Ketosynthase family 3 (KS3) domain-containing protein n=1 Tax=Adineta steineri TaxID=433720 RepID=A0A815SSC1_9BILA|nr:unnamed protein product [Adineta steineri]CAF1642174.1 unnamed protein product [Adineta steineri]